MKIPDEIIDKVKDAVSIVEVISRSVRLKKAGANHKGLCPFHNEKSPSFTVHEGKQIYKCFGCSEGGNVFNFLMKTRNLSFPDAVRELAAEAGIEIPDDTPDDPQAQQRAKEREALFEIMKAAAAWFRKNLTDSREGERARWYAAERGMPEKIQEAFQLGYAPRDGASLERVAEKKGFSQQQLIQAGLLIKNERGVYARFRGRFMFPIADAAGRIVGFGGRVMGEGEPKYLNSPETPLFNKSDLLYALPQAKAQLLKAKRVLVVEGYMDAIACHQAGADYAVATLGTALTPSHAKQLKRYVERVYLVFDSDRAGLAAAQRGAEVLLQAGLDLRVVRLGQHKDPDDFLKDKGLKAFDELLEEALEAPAFFLEAALADALSQTGAPSEKELGVKAKVAAMQGLFPLLAKYDTEMETGTRLRQAAERLDIPADEVLKDFLNFKKGNRPKAMQARVALEESKQRYQGGSLEAIEREIIGILASDIDLRKQMMALDNKLQFKNADLQIAAELLWKYPDKGIMQIELANEESEHFLRGVRVLRNASFKSAGEYKNPALALKDLMEHKSATEEEIRAAEVQDEIVRLQEDPDPDDPDALMRAYAEKTALRISIDKFERKKKSSHVFYE